MTILGEHRGILFYMPHNDDGIWHYRVHLQRRSSEAGRPPKGNAALTNPQGYSTKDEAAAAAKLAIDDWLGTRKDK